MEVLLKKITVYLTRVLIFKKNTEKERNIIMKMLRRLSVVSLLLAHFQ